MIKQFPIIFILTSIILSCDDNNSLNSTKEISNNATKEETENYISKKLTSHSLPWKQGSILISKEKAIFRNDSLIVESMWKYDGRNISDRIVVSTKNKNIGETVRESDSTFFIRYQDRPVTGIMMKIDYSIEKDLDQKLIKAFDHLKSFYLNADTVSNENRRFIGEWNGINYTGTAVTLILDKTGHASIVGRNQVLGGDIEKDGLHLECIYEIDNNTNPMRLDISLRKKGGDETKPVMKGIVRFITDSKIEYRFSDYRSARFQKFDFKDKKNTIVFDKVIK